jgi:transcription elongation factor GreA
VTETQLSPEAYERLSLELTDLTTRGRVEIARQIEAARALGDLSENGDYHAAKDAQGKMEARVRQLQSLLNSAVVVARGATAPDAMVSTGTIVEIRYEGDEGTERYLVGSIEEQLDGLTVVSPAAPLGKALIGHGAGESVSYMTPSGAELRVEIVSVGG